MLLPLLTALGSILAFAYDLVPSYAFAIITLTAVVTLATTPLTIATSRIHARMRRAQPEIDAARARHADDPRAQLAATAEVWRTHRVSPWRMLLPTVVQAPIFIAMFTVLRDAAKSGAMPSFGVNLAQTGFAALASPPSAIAFLSLVVVTVVAGIFVQRVTARRGAAPAGTAGLRRIVGLFPFLSVPWAFALPLAVTLYLATAAVLRLVQHLVVLRDPLA